MCLCASPKAIHLAKSEQQKVLKQKRERLDFDEECYDEREGERKMKITTSSLPAAFVLVWK